MDGCRMSNPAMNRKIVMVTDPTLAGVAFARMPKDPCYKNFQCVSPLSLACSASATTSAASVASLRCTRTHAPTHPDRHLHILHLPACERQNAGMCADPVQGQGRL